MHGCNPGWAWLGRKRGSKSGGCHWHALLGLRGTCDAQAAIFQPPVKRTHIVLQLCIYTYPMTSQGEIGEMSCAEAIGGFASLSGSRGMLLAGLLTAVRRTVGSCVLTQFNDMSCVVW
ncbi:hypothetical protein J3E68DRAFT_388811 [Trichoderma sp. SZMC 28012]